MPIIEIHRDLGKAIDGTVVERTVLDIPDESGTYSTGVGPITMETLEIDIHKHPTKIAIEGEVLKGTSLKDRHKRNPRKVVSLRGEWGQQTLSKRERILVYSQRGQRELSLGVPVVVRNNKI
jgi:hypothetical protein